MRAKCATDCLYIEYTVFFLYYHSYHLRPLPNEFSISQSLFVYRRTLGYHVLYNERRTLRAQGSAKLR